MNELLEKEAFVNGVAVGLYRQKVVSAYERKEHLKVGDNLYYVQDGRERLAEMVEKICR